MVFTNEFNTNYNPGEVIMKGLMKKEEKYKKAKKMKIVEEVDEVSSRQSEIAVKTKSHEELEVEIQSKRILLVLDEAIFKLHIASCLGLLIEHGGKQLMNYLPQEEVEFIVDTCTKYADSDVFDYDSMTSVGSRSKPKFLQQFSRLDVNVMQAIEILSKCKGLKESIGLLPRNESSLNEKFLEGIHRLRLVTAQKLSVSAAEEMQKEKELKIAWKENSEAKLIIANLQEKLNKQTEELQEQLNGKNELIGDYERKIDRMTEKFQTDIKRRVVESEKAMVQSSQLSEERQTALTQEAKQRAQDYQALLETHLTTEKTLRAKRFKVEAQLASWLAKYDQDIGERQAELEELTRLYNEEMEELKTMQMKFDEQEEDYTVLMAERDEYEAGINNQKAYEFLRIRAVRRIQKFWRAYQERKLLKKKSKKGKKKKKSAGESDEGIGSAGVVKGRVDVDPNAQLAASFKEDILKDIDTKPIPSAAGT